MQFLSIRLKGPVDKDPAITGLVSDTKDAFDAFYTKETDLGKKVMGMLGANYGAEFQGKPNSELLAKNLMVSLANLYLADGAKLAAYVEKGYPVDPEKKLTRLLDWILNGLSSFHKSMGGSID